MNTSATERAEAALAERDERWAKLLGICAAQAQNLPQGAAVTAAQAHAAFEQFYRESAGFALGLARRVCGQAFADDVLAEAYLQAWRNITQFDAQRGRASAWLLTMVRSRALDKLRAEQLRQTDRLIGDDGELLADANTDEALSPDALLAQTQSQTRLHLALADLSSNERWVLGLAYFKGMSQSEISLSTCMPLGTVKSLTTRALGKLKAALS